MDGPSTLSDLLRRAARSWPGGIAVSSFDRREALSFAELDRSASLVAQAVAARTEPGDRALVWAPNLPDWIVLEFGLARAGVALVPVNVQATPDEVAHLLRRARPRVAFFAPGPADRPSGEALALAATQAGCAPALVGLAGAEGPGAVAFEDFLARARTPADQVRRREEAVRPTDVAQIQFTSGTTGEPKGVMLTHANLLHNARAIVETLGFEPTDRLCLVVPLFHCFGCVVGALVGAQAGMEVVLHDRFDPDRVLDAVQERRCTAIYGVPTMYVALLEALSRNPRDVSSLRVGVMAGAPCPEDLVRRTARELVAGIVVAYGLTEASPGVTLSRPDEPLDVRAATVGLPLPDVEVAVIDETGRRLPPGEVGELACRGPNVMAGYLDDPQATAETIDSRGFLRTGDLARQRPDGRFVIVGRRKELIIRGGENVAPAEVEAALRRHPAVADAAAFGVPSDYWGEEPAAAVRLREGASVTKAELLAFARDRLPPAKRPVDLLFLQSFPLTGSGKVKRHELLRLFCERHRAQEG